MKINGGTIHKYGERPGAWRKVTKISPPKYRPIAVRPLIMETIRKLSASKFAAASSSLGSMIASSYLMHAITPMIAVIEVNNAKNPKASGPKSRVRRGEAAIAMIWAIVVPVTSLRTSVAKGEDLTGGGCDMGLYE